MGNKYLAVESTDMIPLFDRSTKREETKRHLKKNKRLINIEENNERSVGSFHSFRSKLRPNFRGIRNSFRKLGSCVTKNEEEEILHEVPRHMSIDIGVGLARRVSLFLFTRRTVCVHPYHPYTPEQTTRKIHTEGYTFATCELMMELNKQGFPGNQLSDWICLIEAESSKRTEVIGGPDEDGSYDYGLFQINDRYWCSSDDHPGKGCNVRCSDLLTDNITTASKCALRIYKQQGFGAWLGWQNECRGKEQHDINC